VEKGLRGSSVTHFLERISEVASTVVRPDTGAQFQNHACIRILLVVFSPGGCSFEYIRFHVEWCAHSA
jgi:hypothetical protein